MKPEVLFYLAGATISFLRDVGGGGQQVSLGDALQNLLSSTGRQLKQTPVKKRLHEVTTIEDRIGHIRTMIRKFRYDPKVREITLKILTEKKSDGTWKVAEKDWLGEVRALYKFVRNHTRYARDPWGMDTYTSALRTLTQYKGGDCDDQAILLGTLLQAVGYPLKLKIVQTPPNETFNHIYLVVGMPPMNPQRWIAADTSSGKPLGHQVSRSQIIRKKYFDV